MKRRIVFRADGNNKIGHGHVVRSLALAEMLSDDFNILFIIKQPGSALVELITSFCPVYQLPDFSDADEELVNLEKLVNTNDILVLDGYNFESSYQKAVKNFVHKLVVIDDKATTYFYSDLVINHGGSNLKLFYKTESYTKLLLGWDYLLVRKSFRDAAKQKQKIDKINTLFICMGGSDPFNITGKALKAALECSYLECVNVVVGSSYAYFDELKQIMDNSKKQIIYTVNASTKKMTSLIAASDIAICPASSVALEICCIKAGLLTGTVIDNQAAIHLQLIESGCCITLNSFNNATVEEITAYLQKMNNRDLVNLLVENQSKAIDGLSGERILESFKKLEGE